MFLGVWGCTDACGAFSVNSVESMFDMGLSSVFCAISGPKILG